MAGSSNLTRLIAELGIGQAARVVEALKDAGVAAAEQDTVIGRLLADLPADTSSPAMMQAIARASGNQVQPDNTSTTLGGNVPPPSILSGLVRALPIVLGAPAAGAAIAAAIPVGLGATVAAGAAGARRIASGFAPTTSLGPLDPLPQAQATKRLERQNLLDMPSTMLKPGELVALVYKEASGPGSVADSEIITFVDSGQHLFSLPPVLRDGNAIAVAAKLESDVPVNGLPVLEIFADVERRGAELLDPRLELVAAVKLERTADIAGQVSMALAGAADLPGMQPDPLGLRKVGNAIEDVGDFFTTALVLVLLIAVVYAAARFRR